MDCQVIANVPRDSTKAPRGGEHPWGTGGGNQGRGCKAGARPQLWLAPALSAAQGTGLGASTTLPTARRNWSTEGVLTGMVLQALVGAGMELAGLNTC